MAAIAGITIMGKRRPNHRLVKIHRSYTVEEIASLFGTHKNTVRAWVIFRPAYIYPVEPRKEPNLSYRLLRALYPAFRALFPNQVIRADDLAGVMVDVAARGTEGHRSSVFENRDIRALVASLPATT